MSVEKYLGKDLNIRTLLYCTTKNRLVGLNNQVPKKHHIF